MISKLTILGCGSSVGVPRIDGFWGKCNKRNKKNLRTRCSALITKGSNNVLIDTSPDIKNQLIHNKIKNISSVIFTHLHADQTNGLFELRPFFWKNKKRIRAYGDSTTMNYLNNRFSYLFNKINVYPPIMRKKIIKRTFYIGKGKDKINFKTIKVTHGKIYSIGYIFEKTAYLSDCNDLSIVYKEELRGVKYLILDCLRYKPHPSHFNLKECIYIHSKIKPKKTILTNLHSDLDYNKLSKILPKDMIAAFDGMRINL